jgi:hypothetical protein
MRIAEVDGVGRLEFPDDAPDSVIQSTVQRVIREKAGGMALEGMSSLDKGLAGAGKFISDRALGVKQFLGFSPQSEVDESRQRDSALMKTTAGKVGNFAGAVASTIPTMFIPGVNTYTGSALLGAGLGASEPVADGESRLLNTGIGVVAGVGGKFVGDKAAAYVTRKVGENATNLAAQQSRNQARDATLAAGQKAGYVVPPSYAESGVGSRLLEGISGKYKTNQLAAIKNQEVTDSLVRKSLGLADDAPLTSEAMQNLRNVAYQSGYEPLASAGAMKATPQYDAALNSIVSKYNAAQQSFPGAAKNDVSELVKSFRVKDFDSGSAVQAVRVLRENADDAFRQGNNALGKASKDIAKAIENEIEANLSKMGKPGADLLKNFRDARTLMAKSHTVEDALKEGAGRVNAAKLASRVQAGKPMTGELETIGKFANVFPDVAKMPQSGYANPLTVLDYAAGGIGYGVNPWALALPAARVASRYGILSRPYQSAFVGAPSYAQSALTGSLPRLTGIASRGLPGGIAGGLLANFEQ